MVNENSAQKGNKKNKLINAKNLLKHFGDKRIAILVRDQEIKNTIVHDLKFFGLKKITVFRTKKEFFSKLSTTDPQPEILFSDIYVINSIKHSDTGLYMLKSLHDFALELNFNIEMTIILIARNIDKEHTIECFKSGAKDILLYPSSIVSFGNKLLKWVGKVAENKSESEIEIFLQKGDDFFRKGEFEEAIKQYDIVLKNFGEKADVLERKGQALLASGNYEEAIACFKKSVQIKNDFAKAYQGLGDTYSKLMEYEMARKNYKIVLEIEPDNCYSLYNIGESFRAERKWREAEHVYTLGIKKKPGFFFFRIGLAETFVSTKKINRAIETYKDIIKLKPKNTQFPLRLGDICIENGLYAEAETVLEASIRENESAVILFNTLGIALRKQEKYQEAIKKYQQAIRIDPDDPNLRYNVAKAYFENGEKDKAVESFRISIQMEPSLKESLLKDSDISFLHKDFN